jgi:hypothetical protein
VASAISQGVARSSRMSSSAMSNVATRDSASATNLLTVRPAVRR